MGEIVVSIIQKSVTNYFKVSKQQNEEIGRLKEETSLSHVRRRHFPSYKLSERMKYSLTLLFAGNFKK
jgi:hypothetical protein